ncbi:MAG: aliphatic sulfonates import ATP-binding protein SsuB [Pseudomonadota bacterium]|jgi:sulfonate transport system ATP-binding protein
MIRIELDNVHKRFGTVPVLENLDFQVESGEFVAILGRSGSGKSTLLKLISGLETADRGRIIRNGRIAIAFQEARLMPWLTVG